MATIPPTILGKAQNHEKARFLPGETYKILKDHDEEVVVRERGNLELYPPVTSEQVVRFAEAYKMAPDSAIFAGLLSLAGK